MTKLIAIIENTYAKIGFFIAVITAIGGGAIQYYKFSEEFKDMRKEVKKIEQYKVLFTMALGNDSRKLDSICTVLSHQRKKDNIIISGLTAEFETKYLRNGYLYDYNTAGSVKVYASNEGDKWVVIDEDGEMMLYSAHWRANEHKYGYYNFKNKWEWAK